MWRQIEPFREQILARTTLGILWGAFFWVVAAGIIMPVWLEGSIGSIPTLGPWSGLGHVLYGAVVGVGSATLYKVT